MSKIKINKDRCKGCELCIVACPSKIIKLSNELNKKGFHYAIVDEDECNKCGLCFQMCPDLCIEIEK